MEAVDKYHENVRVGVHQEERGGAASSGQSTEQQAPVMTAGMMPKAPEPGGARKATQRGLGKGGRGRGSSGGGNVDLTVSAARGSLGLGKTEDTSAAARGGVSNRKRDSTAIQEAQSPASQATFDYPIMSADNRWGELPKEVALVVQKVRIADILHGFNKKREINGVCRSV